MAVGGEGVGEAVGEEPCGKSPNAVAAARADKRIGVELKQDSLLDESAQSRVVPLKLGASLWMGERYPVPLRLQSVKERIDAGGMHPRHLDQQVGPALAVARKHKVLVARIQRPGQRNLRAGHELERNPSAIDRLTERRASAGELVDVHVGEVGAQVGSQGDRGDPGLRGGTRHLQRLFELARSVVDPGEDMGVDVDEAAHLATIVA